MKVLLTTGDALYLAENGTLTELPSYRAQQYQAAIEQIENSKAWKTTGKGAQFMGVADTMPHEESKPSFCGLALYHDEFLYTLRLDASGGMFRRDFAETASPEGHIVSGNDVRLGEIAVHGDDVAACVRYPNGQSHIGIYHLPASYCDEITAGDSAETAPSWAPNGKSILFSTCGIARSDRGMAFSPHSIARYYVNAQKMETLLEDEKLDFLAPKEDAQGNLWFIRQPYQQEDGGAGFGDILMDLLLFPVRLLKAVGGFLNAFSVLFGGESLQSNSQQRRDVKSKQKSDKELFYEDMLIRAAENQKENERSGEEYPGILPRSRVLVRRSPDGAEEVIAKAVLDYCLCEDGVVYSNGSHVLHRTADGKETDIAKVRLASRLQCIV